MPKPSFDMLRLTIGGETTSVINEDQVKAHLKDINDGEGRTGWEEGFICGLDAAGVLTTEQHEDLMTFCSEL